MPSSAPCAQPRSQDITIGATLEQDSLSYLEVVDNGMNPEQIPRNQSMADHRAPPVLSPSSNEEGLQELRVHVFQNMPIRLLCIESHSDSSLKISLLERAEIYRHLARKYQADLQNGESSADWIEKHAGYAILSHTWNWRGEVTYGDWQKGGLDYTQPNSQKLINFCKVAWKDYGLTLGWIDTVCINKESSAELDESIRSMYAWYFKANVCITYLAGTTTISTMQHDRWFTRGWTLQELVAPYHIKFYNKDWQQLSQEYSDTLDPLILSQIKQATSITQEELQNIRGTSISRRMQLAAVRQVTREEDIAYCLMGIFDVSISTAYGEGAEHAFFRLIEEIFRTTRDVSDIFNWAGDCARYSRQPVTSLFPFRPSDYLRRSKNERLRPWRPIQPLTLTHMGLRTPVLLMHAIEEPSLPNRVLDPNPVFNHQSVGNYHATISSGTFSGRGEKSDKKYYLLHKWVLFPETLSYEDVQQRREHTVTFGTLTVEEHGTSIQIPKTCLAVLFKQPQSEESRISSEGYQRVYTTEPIVFNLEKAKKDSDDEEQEYYYQLERSQLEIHGMELVTLYL